MSSFYKTKLLFTLILLVFSEGAFIDSNSDFISDVGLTTDDSPNYFRDYMRYSNSPFERFSRNLANDHMLRFARNNPAGDRALRFTRNQADDHLLRFAKKQVEDHLLRYARSSPKSQQSHFNARNQNDEHMLRFARNFEDEHMLRFARSSNPAHDRNVHGGSVDDSRLRFPRNQADEHMLRFSRNV